MARRPLSMCVLVLAFFTLLPPTSSFGRQLEQAVLCDANGEPQPERALIAYGQHTEGCQIIGPADRDNFTFAGTASDVVRINVRSTTPRLDLRLELRDPTGVVLIDTSCFGEVLGNGIQCSISQGLALAATGTFSITISDQNGDETGGYILQLERIPPTFEPPQVPYDSQAAVRDVVDQPTDLDFFVFDGVAGTTIQLTLSSRTPRLDPRLEVRGPTGAVLIDTSCSGENVFGDGILCSVVASNVVLPATGRYLVIVSDSGIDETGTYDLTLNCIFGACPTTRVNSPPRLAAIGAKSIAKGQLLTFTISAADPDSDPLTFTATGLPGGASFLDNGNGTAVFSWTPAADQPAQPAPVTFFVSDGSLVDFESVTISVIDGNRPPQIAALADQQVVQGNQLTTSISATDPDGNRVALRAVRLPDGATFADNGNGTGALTWSPGPVQLGTFLATFEARDDGTPPLTSVARLAIHVLPPEPAVTCDANGQPQPERALIAYGQHTEGCRIIGADRDNFFAGTAGDVVRLNVHSTTPHLDPRLELRDPTGVVLIDTSCSGENVFGDGIQCSISQERTLAATGTYSIRISDQNGGRNRRVHPSTRTYPAHVRAPAHAL